MTAQLTAGPLKPLYVDEFQASEITGIKVSTLRNHRHKQKGLPYIKIGSSVRYKVTDITDHMRCNRIE